MYRVEFIKQNLNGKGSVIDEEVGRIDFRETFENGRLISVTVAGTLYGKGWDFSTIESAEDAAEKFKKIFTPFPERYKVTTEVYRICE